MRKEGRREGFDTSAHVIYLPMQIMLLNLVHMNLVRSFCDFVLEFTSIVDLF